MSSVSLQQNHHLEEKINKHFSQLIIDLRKFAPVGLGSEDFYDLRESSSVLGFNHPLVIRSWLENSFTNKESSQKSLLQDLQSFLEGYGLKRKASFSSKNQPSSVSYFAGRNPSFFDSEFLKELNQSDKDFVLTGILPFPIYFSNVANENNLLQDSEINLARTTFKYLKEAKFYEEKGRVSQIQEQLSTLLNSKFEVHGTRVLTNKPIKKELQNILFQSTDHQYSFSFPFSIAEGQMEQVCHLLNEAF